MAPTHRGVPCDVCHHAALAAVPGYADLRRVTSDCHPWPAGGALCVCRACGCAQKEIGPAWEREVRTIYAEYDIYHQSAGVEQSVFDADSGGAAARSERLLNAVWSHLKLPARGRLLDLGCGNGALLRSCGRVAPQWTLAGSELTDRHRDEVESLPGVAAFHSCPLADIPGPFDVITMNHVLEHIPGPIEFLQQVRGKLAPEGALIIQTPNLGRNPFDLLVADHASHLVSAMTAWIASQAGHEVVLCTEEIIPKETTVIARASGEPAQPAPAVDPAAMGSFAAACVDWLAAVRDQARQIAGRGRFGLFGTAIAGTWLCGELGEAVRFFVDEDPHRIGQTHLGRPIHSPRQVAPGSDVYLALTPEVAAAVQEHAGIGDGPATYHAPPPLPQWTGAGEWRP